MRPMFALAVGVLLIAATLQGQSQPAGSPKPARLTALPRALPGTRVDAFSTINGSAFDADNVILPSSLVRLRSARVGQLVDTQVTNKSGVFSFYRVDPGYYIVELFDSERKTLAASPIVATGPGTTASTSVRLPVKSSMLSSLLLLGPGGSSNQASGVTRQPVSQVPPAVLQTIPAVVPVGDPVSER
jgi:hypothetical protein